MNNPAAWHPDPTSAHEYRWWDGERWTEHVADAGQASIDPLPGGAGSGAAESADTRAGGVGSASHVPSGDADPGDGSDGAHDVGTASGSWQQPESAEGPGTTAEQPAQQAGQGWQQPDHTAQQPQQTWQQPAQGAGGGSARGWQQSPAGQPQPSWSQPGASQPATGNNGIAIAALVIGILSLLISWIPFLGLLGALGGIVALILGFVGRGRFKKSPGVGGNGAAITGIVTGILALLVAVLVTVAIFTFGGTFFGTYAECVEQGGSDVECQRELERELMDRFG